MTTSLAGRTAVVTGAGRGIGRATAHLLSKIGAAVVVNDLGAAVDGQGADSTPAETVAKEIRDAGGKAVANRDSVTDWDGAGRIIQTAIDHFGGIDILVNNAGVNIATPIWALDPALFERVCDSHVKGTFNCTRHAIPHMMAKRWGRIVNLVSRAGLIGIPENAAHGAGKGGVNIATPIWALDPALFERVCDSHVKGTFNCTRHAIPHMMAKRWGRIVNLVSRAGLIGIPENAAYGAGKGGVFGFTNVIARDLAPYGICVNAVNPSSTETRMVTTAVETFRKQGGDAAVRAENLMKVAQQPEDVAVLIASLCSEEIEGINGQVFIVAKGEIGLFQPITVGQSKNNGRGWNIDELVKALGDFEPYPLDAPYGR